MWNPKVRSEVKRDMMFYIFIWYFLSFGQHTPHYHTARPWSWPWRPFNVRWRHSTPLQRFIRIHSKLSELLCLTRWPCKHVVKSTESPYSFFTFPLAKSLILTLISALCKTHINTNWCLNFKQHICICAQGCRWAWNMCLQQIPRTSWFLW